MRSSTRGFTLIELLVAIVLLGVGLLALASNAVSVRKLYRASRFQAQAGMIGTGFLEQGRATAFPNLTSMAPVTVAGLDGASYSVTTIVTAPSAMTRQMLVIVSYQNGLSTRVRADSFITSIGQ
jgi:prepilin-type N-terminal cleavage/methylation domain-containing protein